MRKSVSPANDDDSIVVQKRVGPLPGFTVMLVGAALLFLGLAGWGMYDWTLFTLLWGVGGALAIVGYRWFSRRGKVWFELVATPSGVRWAEHGVEASVEFAELESVSLVDNADMADYFRFRTTHGRELKLYRADHERLFYFIRRHFAGPMDWFGESVTEPNAKLPTGLR